MNKKSRFLWYLVGIGSLVLFLLILLSSVLNVGDKLSKISIYLEIAFYVLVGIIIYFLIINPLKIILLSPSFSVKTVLDKDTKRNYGLYKKISKNILKSNILTDKEKGELKNSLNSYDKLKKQLNILFNSSIKREINKVIINNAKTVMISTAISPNPRVDLISVFTVNLKLIKEIVVLCGFRPNFKNLSKLSINVFGTALIAEGLENLNLDDVLPKDFSSMLSEVPFLKPIFSGVSQGIANALLTIRIGVITRRYLFKEGEEVTKDSIRRQSLKEALKMLPQVVSSSFMSFPSKLASMFKK